MKKLFWILLSFVALGAAFYVNVGDVMFGEAFHVKYILSTAGYAVFWGFYMKYNAKLRGMMVYPAVLAGGALLTALSAFYSITFQVKWKLLYLLVVLFLTPIHGLFVIFDFNTTLAYGVVSAVSIG